MEPCTVPGAGVGVIVGGSGVEVTVGGIGLAVGVRVEAGVVGFAAIGVGVGRLLRA